MDTLVYYFHYFYHLYFYNYFATCTALATVVVVVVIIEVTAIVSVVVDNISCVKMKTTFFWQSYNNYVVISQLPVEAEMPINEPNLELI